MTRRQLRNTIFIITLLYSLALITGITLYFTDTTEKKINFAIFKDLIPFMIAIPIAYLGYCFQRRANYLLALRPLWSNLIISVNKAIQFTHDTETGRKDYADTLNLLSVSIDEVRGVYSNLKIKNDGIGYYPFESLKTIHKIISELGYGAADISKSTEARKQIKHHRKNIRQTFLMEFDRPEPTIFDSPYISDKKKPFLRKSGDE